MDVFLEPVNKIIGHSSIDKKIRNQLFKELLLVDKSKEGYYILGYS